MGHPTDRSPPEADQRPVSPAFDRMHTPPYVHQFLRAHYDLLERDSWAFVLLWLVVLVRPTLAGPIAGSMIWVSINSGLGAGEDPLKCGAGVIGGENGLWLPEESVWATHVAEDLDGHARPESGHTVIAGGVEFSKDRRRPDSEEVGKGRYLEIRGPP
ncbi:hypothetical protein SDJN03_07036, partial [Cucurbita argyrosperma subsp. sororia]